MNSTAAILQQQNIGWTFNLNLCKNLQTSYSTSYNNYSLFNCKEFCCQPAILYTREILKAEEPFIVIHFLYPLHFIQFVYSFILIVSQQNLKVNKGCTRNNIIISMKFTINYFQPKQNGT